MDILAFNSFHLRQKLGFPGGARDKEPFVNAGDIREAGSSPGQEDPLEEGTATTPVFLPGESSWTEESGGLESIAPQKKSDTTEGTYQTRLKWHFSFSTFIFQGW